METTRDRIEDLFEAARYYDLDGLKNLASASVSLDSKDSWGRTGAPRWEDVWRMRSSRRNVRQGHLNSIPLKPPTPIDRRIRHTEDQPVPRARVSTRSRDHIEIPAPNVRVLRDNRDEQEQIEQNMRASEEYLLCPRQRRRTSRSPSQTLQPPEQTNQSIPSPSGRPHNSEAKTSEPQQDRRKSIQADVESFELMMGMNLDEEALEVKILEPEGPSGFMPAVASTTVAWRSNKKQKRVEEEVEGEGEKEKFAPERKLNMTDSVQTIDQIRDFFRHCLPPADRKILNGVNDENLINSYYKEKYLSLSMEIELIKRFEVLRLNHLGVESERDSLKKQVKKLKDKIAELEAQVNKEIMLISEGLQQDLNFKRSKVEELKEAKNRWEAEANRLRERYETPEGFIKVLTSFLMDARCENMFVRLGMFAGGELLEEVQKHFQRTDPTFQLPEEHQSLIQCAERNIYPWNGGAFNFQELIAPDSEGSDDEEDLANGQE